jgi:hypothetical protein
VPVTEAMTAFDLELTVATARYSAVQSN